MKSQMSRRVALVSAASGLTLAIVGCTEKPPAPPAAKLAPTGGRESGVDPLVHSNDIGGDPANTGKSLVEFAAGQTPTDGRLLILYGEMELTNWIVLDLKTPGSEDGEYVLPGANLGIFKRLTWRAAKPNVPALIAGWVPDQTNLHKLQAVWFPVSTAPAIHAQPESLRPRVSNNGFGGGLGHTKQLVEFGAMPNAGKGIILLAKNPGANWQTAPLTEWVVFETSSAAGGLNIANPADGRLVPSSGGYFDIATRPTPPPFGVQEMGADFAARALTIFLPTS